MEELLIVILQGLFELLLQSVFYYPFDWPWSDSGRKDKGSWLWIVLFLGLGLAVGLVVNVIYPRVLIPYGWARMLNLLVGPIVAGTISLYLAKWRRKRDADVHAWKHFLCSAAFTLGFVVIRFAYGQR